MTGLFVDDATFARMRAEADFYEELAACHSRTRDDGSRLLEKSDALFIAGQVEVGVLEAALERARAAQIKNANAGRAEIDTALSNRAIRDERRAREQESDG